MPDEPLEVMVKANAQSTKRVPVQSHKSASLAEKMSRLLEKVRLRANELFQQRGGEHGHDLDDWLRAEDELGVLSVAEVEESDKEFRIRIRGAGLEPGELTVYAEPQAITVEGKSVRENLSTAESAVGEYALFGRYDLPHPIETDEVSAGLENGVLEIVAKKMTAAPKSGKEKQSKSTAA